jgi:hypothetical protein
MPGGASVWVMEKPVLTREDFRRLPPRITPEEMVPVQPVAHPVHDPQVGTADEWRIRMGGAG